MRKAIFCAVLVLSPVAAWAAGEASGIVFIAQSEALAAQIPLAAQDAVQGDADAFRRLESMQRKGERVRDVLARNTGLVTDWAKLDADIATVLAARKPIEAAAWAASDLNSKLPVLSSRLDEVTKILSEKKGSAESVLTVANTMRLIERMQRRIQYALSGGEETASVLDNLARDYDHFLSLLDGLIDGSERTEKIANPSCATILQDIRTQAKDLSKTVADFRTDGAAIEAARKAAQEARDHSQSYLLTADAVIAASGA
jgi:hypothetical protein